MFSQTYGLIAAIIGSAQGGLLGYWLINSYKINGVLKIICILVCVIIGVVVGFMEIGILHGVVFRNKSDRNS
jgi:hypothetical protein